MIKASIRGLAFGAVLAGLCACGGGQQPAANTAAANTAETPTVTTIIEPEGANAGADANAGGADMNAASGVGNAGGPPSALEEVQGQRPRP